MAEASGSESVLYVRVPPEVKQRLHGHFPARKLAPWVRDVIETALAELDEAEPDFNQLTLDGEAPAA